MTPREEELRELYRQMPTEKFVKVLQHQNPENYIPEALKIIREISEERKNELEEYLSEEQKELFQKEEIMKKILTEVEKKFTLIQREKQKSKLENKYKELVSSANVWLSSKEPGGLNFNLMNYFEKFFEINQEDIGNSLIQELKKFNVLLDKKLKKHPY